MSCSWPSAMDVVATPLWTVRSKPVECCSHGQMGVDPLFAAFQSCTAPQAKRIPRGTKRYPVLGNAGQCDYSPTAKRMRLEDNIVEIVAPPASKREPCWDDEVGARKGHRSSLAAA